MFGNLFLKVFNHKFYGKEFKSSSRMAWRMCISVSYRKLLKDFVHDVTNARSIVLQRPF